MKLRKCKKCAKTISPFYYYKYLIRDSRKTDFFCDNCGTVILDRKSANALIVPSVVSGFGLGSIVTALIGFSPSNMPGLYIALSVLLLGILGYLLVIYYFMPIKSISVSQDLSETLDIDETNKFKLLNALVFIPYLVFCVYAYITGNYISFCLALVASSITSIRSENTTIKWFIVTFLTILSVILFHTPR